MPMPDAIRSQPGVRYTPCGGQQILEVIANQWTELTIRVLARGTRRDSEQNREIGGVSRKMRTTFPCRTLRHHLWERRALARDSGG